MNLIGNVLLVSGANEAGRLNETNRRFQMSRSSTKQSKGWTALDTADSVLLTTSGYGRRLAAVADVQLPLCVRLVSRR